jgi:replicative DNA helicase
VVDEMKASGALLRFPAGEAGLTEAMQAAPFTDVARQAAVRMVAEKAALRAIVRVATEAASRASGGAADSGEVADELGAALVRLRMRSRSDLIPVREPIATFIGELEQRSQAREIRGVSSAIATLDRYTGGFLPGQLVVIAARPGMGKTAFALNVCRNLVRKGGAALFLSLEMTTPELVERLMVQETQADSALVRSGRGINWQAFVAAQDRMENAALYVVDDVQTAAQIGSVARRFRARHPQQDAIVALDYLQLVRMSGRNGQSRAELVGDVSADMKRLAKSIGAPVLELSQLSRSSEHEGRAPKLSDLRDSGAIEQDADLVIFPHNPQKVPDGNVELVLAKNRNGAIGSTRAWWKGSTYTFSDVDDSAGNAEHWSDS